MNDDVGAVSPGKSRRQTVGPSHQPIAESVSPAATTNASSIRTIRSIRDAWLR